MRQRVIYVVFFQEGRFEEDSRFLNGMVKNGLWI